MQELSTNTQGADASARPKPTYDIYFSYNEADGPWVEAIHNRLSEVIDGFTGFDEFELTTGESQTRIRERALADSASVAVLLGSDRPSKTVEEEFNQTVRQAVQQGTRAFVVYLPGWDGETELRSSWLADRGRPIDLREQFDADRRLAREALVPFIEGVLGKTRREALAWLAERDRPPPDRSARPPRLRAMLVGIRSYDGFPELPAADVDVRALEQVLRPAGTPEDEGWWDLLPRFEGRTREDLGDAARTFFTEDVGEDETLLFYFSGHGVVYGKEDVHLVVEQTRQDDILITAFPVKALAGYVAASPARRKLVIIDCCHSGEASEADWGAGSAVFLTSRQAVAAGAGPSELTGAIASAWESGPGSTGDLRDRLGQVEVRFNEQFDRTIPLPGAMGGERWSAPESLPSARLSFDKRGDLYVSLTSKAGEGRPTEMAGWMESRRSLVGHLIDMIDAVVSFVPADSIPMDGLMQALASLGQDFLDSMLPSEVRAELGQDLEDWDALRLELSFDDRWSEHDAWERVPWESLSLCQDQGRRAIWLERIVRAKEIKGTVRRRPSRVIAWNAFTETNPRYQTKAEHLLTHLLLEMSHRYAESPVPVVKEKAAWDEFVEASELKEVKASDPGEPESVDVLKIADFDTFLLFAPVSLFKGEPVVWLHLRNGIVHRGVQSLVEQLDGKWNPSYLVIETIAGPSASLHGGSEPDLHDRTLQATTQLATQLARKLGIAVIAVCHLSSFIDAARPAGDEEKTFVTSFSGELLRKLADPNLTLYEAAMAARRLVVARLDRENSLDVGLPIVCRPERESPGAARASAGGSKAPRATRSRP